MSAVTTYIGLKIAQEAVRYPPDLVILYFGHNEFIGNGGMGRFHSPVFQLKVFLSKLRLYQWLNSSLQSLFKKEHIFLMQEMAKKNRIVYQSTLYQKTLADFEQNYDSIIKLFTEKHIPVIGCGVVGNIKDVPPLSSVGVKADEIASALEKTFEESSGEALCQKIDKLVNDNAPAAFLAGQRFLSFKQFELARRYLWRACDYDQLRFRAPSDINRIIAKTCRNNKSTFIDFQNIIDKTDVHGITGNSQLLEHVHPNLQTTQLIAKTLGDSIAKRFLVRSISLDMPVKLLRDLVEKEHAAGIMMSMFVRFPYKELQYINPEAVGEVYKFSGDTSSPVFSDFSLLDTIDKNEYAFIRKCFRDGLNPAQVHLKRGSHALENENYSDALQENLIAYNQMPSNYTIGNNLAVSFAFMGDLKNAESLLWRLYDMGNDDIIIYKNLWLLNNMVGYSDKAGIIEKHLRAQGINTLTIRELLFFY
jgi:tetratricopeptide (TPR) repeat protein